MQRRLIAPIVLALLFLGLSIVSVMRGGHYLIPSLLLGPVFLGVYQSLREIERIRKGAIQATDARLQIMLISSVTSMMVAFAAGIYVAGGLGH